MNLRRTISRIVIFITITISFFSVHLMATAQEQGVSDSAASGLFAGVARTDITPRRGIAQMNWGSSTHVESTGNDPDGMYGTAMVFSDGEDRVAIISVDHGSIRPFKTFVKRAAKASGINEKNIFLFATHTHSGPAANPNKGPLGADLSKHVAEVDEHFATAETKLIEAVVEANANMVPVHIYGQRGEGTINMNRRYRAKGDNPPAVGLNPDEFVDRELVVFRVDDAQGSPLAVLANFQVHGTVLGYTNKVISPGWVGAMRRTVENNIPGTHLIFLQGAAGDQGPVEGFTNDLSVAHRLGSILGHQTSALAIQTDTVKRAPVFEGLVQSAAIQAKQHWKVKGPYGGDIKTANVTFDVPARTYSDQEVNRVKQQRDAASRDLEALSPDDKHARHKAKAKLHRLEELYKRWSTAKKNQTRQVELRAVKIGDVAFITFPGEAFAKIGADIKKASPFPFTMFVGYTTGVGAGYLPTSDEYQHGGYEVDATPYDPGTDKLVIEAGIALLKQLHAEN